jgi:hypothetical protein
MNFSDASPNNGGAISETEDIIARPTYEELSLEFKTLYPTVSRAFQLISLMYDRLTMEDKFSHKEAISKIYEDHKHLQGFSQRNIRRSLMSLENPNIPHRISRKIRPSWPNSVDLRSSIDVDDQKSTDPSSKTQVTGQNHELANDLPGHTECYNCSVLLLQAQKLEKERSKVLEGYDQALQIIKEQGQKIIELQDAKSCRNQPVTNNNDILEEEIALRFEPLRQAMASAFRLKENKFWLTIRFSRNTGSIIAVYTCRKSGVAKSSHSILSSGHE